jgi:predicted phosphodiesterase
MLSFSIMMVNNDNATTSSITLVAGDTHLHPAFLERISYAADAVNANRIILLGDYMDYWHANTAQYVGMAEALKDWVVNDKRMIDLILGNHDIPYYIGSNDPLFSFIKYRAAGMNMLAVNDVHEIYNSMRMQVSTTLINPVNNDVYICTHAGLTQGWLNTIYKKNKIGKSYDSNVISDLLNEMQAHGEWRALYACGALRGGHDGNPSPLWADKNELELDPVIGLNQIVGHAPVNTVHIDLNTNANIVFCDTMSFMSNDKSIGDGSLLVIGDDSVSSSNSAYMVHHMAPGLHILTMK